MALDFWWLRHSTTSSFGVAVRCTANDTVDLIIGGATVATATADTTVADGVVNLRATGLAQDTRYSFTINVNSSAAATGEGRTYHPDRITIASGSCKVPLGNLMFEHAYDRDVDLFVLMGDLYYEDNASSANGVTTIDLQANVANLTNQAARYAHYRQAFKSQSFLRMIQKVPFLHVVGDHELWNDFSGGTDAALLQSCLDELKNDAGCDLTAAQLGRTVAYRGYADYSLPSDLRCSDPGVDSSVDGVPLYFRFRAGPVELFALDGYSHRSDIADADTTSKKFLGETQTVWAETYMAASAAPWKFAILPTTFFKVGPNSDTYADSGGANEGFQYDALDFIWRTRNIDDLLMVCGDQHLPAVQYAEPGLLDAQPQAQGRTGYPAVLVPLPCPVATNSNTNYNSTYGVGVASRIFAAHGYVGLAATCWSNRSLLITTINGEAAEHELLDVQGRAWWSATIVSGSRIPQYPTQVLPSACL